MKKLAILLTVLMLFTLSSCSEKRNTVLYESQVVKLTLDSVSDKAIVFNCENKTDNSFYTSLSVGLDGTLAKDSPHIWLVGAKSTEKLKFDGDNSYDEHKFMNLHADIYGDTKNMESFDVCNFVMGKEKNTADLPQGELLYEDEDVKIEYVDTDKRGVNLKIENIGDIGVNLLCESFCFTSGGERQGFHNNNNSFAVIPPKTQGIFNIDLETIGDAYLMDRLETFDTELLIQYTSDERDNRKFNVSYRKNQ